jgi:hypothetical protein
MSVKSEAAAFFDPKGTARANPRSRDLGGNGVGEFCILEFRHYCSESNVLLAPIHLQDHLSLTARDRTEYRESNPKSRPLNLGRNDAIGA